MKLIETNFGRIKNDPIKQGRWITEYEKLKGVRQGSAFQKADPNNSGQVSQDDIAKELGISVDTISNLKKLLKLDPSIQKFISEGKLSPTVGFKVISKLSLEDQHKLLDKLPDDVKFAAKTIAAKIDEIRAESAANANAVQQENDALRGRNDKLTKENNDLRAGRIDVSEATQNKINTLEEDKRKYYEKSEKYKKDIDLLRNQLDKAIMAMRDAEAKAKGGDEAIIAYENEIDELNKRLNSLERERNDFEFQLEEKKDEISKLKLESKDRFIKEETNNGRAVNAFKVKIINTVNAFQSAVNDLASEMSLISSLEDDTIKALNEITEGAINQAKILHGFFEHNLDNIDGNEVDDYDEDDINYGELIASGIGA